MCVCVVCVCVCARARACVYVNACVRACVMCVFDRVGGWVGGCTPGRDDGVIVRVHAVVTAQVAAGHVVLVQEVHLPGAGVLHEQLPGTARGHALCICVG